MKIFGVNKTYFKGIQSLQVIQERLPSPESYQKAIITKNLIENGIEDDESLEEEGGLNFEKYNYFRTKLMNRIKVADEIISDFPLDKLSGRNTLYGITDGVNHVLATKKALVLLVDFKDRVNQTNADYIRDILFSTGKNSMRDYFREVSAEKMDIKGEVMDWITLGNYENYLKVDTRGSDVRYVPHYNKIINDAVKLANDNGVLSNSTINSTDIFILVIAGEGSNRTLRTLDITPHRGPMPVGLYLAGKRIDNYIIINELPIYDIGGYCHEVAHALGLPDLYLESGYSMMVGRWCLMGAGSYNDDGKKPAHLSAWCKMKLGWVNTIDIKGETSQYEIYDVYGKDGEVYKLDIPDSYGKEYYLLENRQQVNYDEFLPSSGILIWHINENGFYKNCPNFDLNHISISMKQADGKKELEKVYNSKFFLKDMSGALGGDEGDVYPGKTNNRAFNTNSKPNSNSYSGKDSGISVEFISDDNNVMKVVMGYKKSIYDTEYDTECNMEYDTKKILHEQYYPKISTDMKVILKSPEKLTKNSSSEFMEGYQDGYKRGYALARIRLLK